MNMVYATYNIHHNSIDVYTHAGYFLRIDCGKAEKGLKNTAGSECALNALAIDEPLEYVRLYLESNMQIRLRIISGQGFMPVEGNAQPVNFGTSVCRIPLFRGNKQITRNYCLFWKRYNSGYYVEEFADILKNKYV